MGMSGETKLYIPKVRDIVTGTVVNVTESEVLVDVGYTCEGVIYKDHVTNDKNQSLKDMFKVGDPIKVKITQFKQGDDSDQLLLSRLDILKQEKIEKFKDDLEIDKDVTFKVKKSVKGGLLLDYHGIEAFLESLVSLRDDSQEKQDLVGKEIEARIIEIDTSGRRDRIIANRKQLQYETLKEAEKEEFDNINVDDVLKGKVTRITNYGAFVSIGEYTEGLVHISQISHFHVKNVENFLEINQEVEVKVIKIKGKRISLSMKALEETPWQMFLKKYKVGDLVTGKVVRKMQYGMLVEVEREVVGLLKLKITSINKSKEQFSLSKKHLEYNPWADLKFKKGELVSAEVKRIEEKGAVLEVEGVEAFMPIGEVSVDHIDRVDQVLKVDQIITAEIIEFNPKRWLMTLSMKSIVERKSREAYESQLEENVSANQSLHDLFKEFKK